MARCWVHLEVSVIEVIEVVEAQRAELAALQQDAMVERQRIQQLGIPTGCFAFQNALLCQGVEEAVQVCFEALSIQHDL